MDASSFERGEASPCGFVWDRRVRAWRAPAWHYGDLVARLRAEHHARTGADASDGLAAAESGWVVEDHVAVRQRRAHPPVDSSAWCAPLLRPYQDAALLSWSLAGRRGIVVLPTGSGKTRVAIAAMASSGASTLCLVPTRVLLHQWCAELAQHYAGPIGRMGDGAHERQAVCVATFESAYRHMDRMGADYDLLVVDEAHHFGGGCRDEALEMSVARFRLGLTATPPAAGIARTQLDRLLGPIVHEMSVADLAGSYLADFDVVTVRVAFDRSEREQHDGEVAAVRAALVAFRRHAPRGSWDDFIAHASRSPQGRAALASWRLARRLRGFNRAKAAAVEALLGRHRHARVLVFTADNPSAYAIARHNLVMPITCDISKAERDDALAAFRRGELRALVSSRVLNEGIDVPDADVAIVVGASGGEREHVQRIGRLLRPAPGKRAVVYELVTTGTSEVRSVTRRRKALGWAGRRVA